MSHVKLSFSNTLALDGEVYDASLDFIFEKKVDNKVRHKLQLSLLLKQTSKLQYSDELSFIAPNNQFWDKLSGLKGKDTDLSVSTDFLNNVLPNEEFREGIFFIEKSDSENEKNVCGTEIMSYFVLKTPVLVVNDLKKLKQRFFNNYKEISFNKPPFQLISEVSLVKINLFEENKDLENFRSALSSVSVDKKKNKFGFARFKQTQTKQKEKTNSNSSIKTRDNKMDINSYLGDIGSININDKSKKFNGFNTGRYKYIADAESTPINNKSAQNTKDMELSSQLRFKENNVEIEADQETIVEPQTENDVKNLKVFQYNDSHASEVEQLRKLYQDAHMRHKQKQDEMELQHIKDSKLDSIDDIKNFKNFKNFKFSQIEAREPETYSYEKDKHTDSGMNGSLDYAYDTSQLENTKKHQDKLTEVYSSDSNLNKNKNRKLPPKGLLANFKLSTAINPNGSVSVELNQFKSSLENIYNKGYADALEDLGMDPRNAYDPNTKDAYNHLRDINHDKRDYTDFSKNFRFKEQKSSSLNSLKSSKAKQMKMNKKTLKTSKSPNNNYDNYFDEIYDPVAVAQDYKENQNYRNLLAQKTKYHIDEGKKKDLLKIKKNIVGLGHYLKDNKISYGPLYDLFNGLYDNYSKLLKDYSKSNKSILNDLSNQNQQDQQDNSVLRFNQKKSRNYSYTDPIDPASASASDNQMLKKHKTTTTGEDVDLDKWSTIKSKLKTPNYADFNIYSVSGRNLKNKYKNVFDKKKLISKGVLDLDKDQGVFDGQVIDKNDFKILKDSYTSLFNNVKDSQRKYDKKGDYQVNYFKVGFKQKPETKLNNEFNFHKLPKLTKVNVQLTQDDIDKALRDSDYVDLGHNMQNDNVFRRGLLYNDKDSFSTVVTPSYEKTKPHLKWNDAKFKLANGYYKYHNPVQNYRSDFGFNKAENNWSEFDEVNTIGSA